MQPMQPHGNNRWDGRDDVSFEFQDSERFEEDSQVSLDDSIDENQHNWRGWADCSSTCEAIQPGLSCVVYQYHNTSGRYSSASTRTVVAGDPNNPLAHHPMMSRGDNPTGILLTLSEISAKVCAEKWSFQQLEEMYMHICVTRAEKMNPPPPMGPIPEKIFVSFIVHCFPQSTDEIRMYRYIKNNVTLIVSYIIFFSTLANGSADQYEFGKMLYQWGNVRDVSQTGFLLSGNISNTPPDAGNSDNRDSFHVTVKVDRCRIVECTCECSNRSSWCKHVVALCIYRISERSQIKFKETIADAINSMDDKDLRKLVQWHINDIPRKCIPGFQKLIDQIKDPNSTINRLLGAPDPTDGGHEPISRYDFPEIENKVRRLLIKYCVPAPAVHCDVQYLSSVQHPTHTEWTTMIKPLRCREPEGMWNLLQMVREMFARSDDNAVALLRTITDECLSNSQVLLWWYISKLVQSGNWTQANCFKAPDSQYLAQLHCSQLCDEVVLLWKLVAINPRAGKNYRSQLAGYLQAYHRTAVTRLKNMITSAPPEKNDSMPSTDATVLSNYKIAEILQTITNVDIRYQLSAVNMKFTLNCFPGFYPAIQMCHYLNEQNIRFGVRENAIFYVSEPNLTVSYKMVPPHREKSLKKKKRKKKLLKKRMEEEGQAWPIRKQEEYRGVDGVWRVVEEDHDMNQSLNDSTESGQESDVQKGPQRPEVPKKKKIDSAEMDVNEVLAASFSPLDALEARFLRVEAYGTHGYRADAIENALKNSEYLVDSLAEQCQEFVKTNEERPSTSQQSASTSSSSSNVSDEITGSDRDEEVAKANRFLSTMEKILYLTKVLKDSPHLQHTVFDISMRTLSLPKYPFYTKHHQILFIYLETESLLFLYQARTRGIKHQILLQVGPLTLLNLIQMYLVRVEETSGSKLFENQKNQFHAARRNKKRNARSFSNDPGTTVTDAAVYHMQELSKKILFEAGGTQNNAVWGGQNLGGTNRRLHLCAMAISIYALGMSNRISPNWNTRTYSNIASWITAQVEDIGSSSLELMREIWMAHFTPNEVAQMSDRIAPASDPAMRHEAGRMALSVLPFAHALTDDEVIHALRRCQQGGRDMSTAALLAMDTTQFREVGRSRPLFEAMNHWQELSYPEDRQQNPMRQQAPPAGLVANPYVNAGVAQQVNVPNQPANRRQHPPRGHILPPLQQVALLYPQVYEADPTVLLPPSSYRHENIERSRFHHSRSAPQLGGQEENADTPRVVPNQQYMVPPPVPGNALLNAWHYGMRAMDCLATSPGEDRQMYLKFTSVKAHSTPPYADDIQNLHFISVQLGTEYIRTFYQHAARTILSPYVLHNYAKESVRHFPHLSVVAQNPRPADAAPVPLIPTNFPPPPNRNLSSIRYPNVKYCTAGHITTHMISCGYHEITGELFERCCDQYLQATVNKMNSPRIVDNSDGQLCDFVRGAYDAFQCIPHIGRQLFEDFVRAFKRQKAYKRESAVALNPLLQQLCAQ
ncbi:hypothetical protein CRE_02729 [Caenorhabditis remanei]|uniref:SWIM-type domain-containing protein n=1 Tax=Caenorhabditis remanei TaxID=31234 RepID=E3NQ83_CAERE|nr:hypothetical protein CRE_02729 [Caenorhabditis remanei]